MNIDKIANILDLAKTARKLGKIWNPMFVGEAGVGKTEAIHQWVQKQRKQNPEFGLIDIRSAFFEGPDLIGIPYKFEDANGVTRQGNSLPDFWPTSGEGVILLEEPNRGTRIVQNCFLQLTDKNRSIGTNYKLPEGWIIVGSMNPEGGKYDVDDMDVALRNRFEIFNIEFSYNAFIAYIKKANWHKHIVSYLNTGVWVYKKPDSLGTEASYVSPRTWSKLEALESTGISENPANKELHYIACTAILGKLEGSAYWKYTWDDQPVTAEDIIRNKEKAIAKIKEISSNNTYAGDKIDALVKSVTEAYGGWYEGKMDGNKPAENNPKLIDEATMAEIAKIIPADQAVNLISNCAKKLYKSKLKEFFVSFCSRHPDCIAILRDSIKLSSVYSNIL